MTDADSRARALRGLRDLVTFLDAHPQIPVPTRITIEAHAARDLDAAERFARIAHHMGARVRVTHAGVQRAERAFGPVALAAVYHPAVLT